MKIAVSLALVLSVLASVATAFAPSGPITIIRLASASATIKPTTPLSVIPIDMSHVILQDQVSAPMVLQQQQLALNNGVRSYVYNLPSKLEETSTMTLSLKERPPPPTKEELEQKKRNFNLWFWGGGFVAPFLATFYYFGFKFWEK